MRFPWQKPPIKYERWFDTNNSSWMTMSCKHLVVEGEKVFIENYYYGDNEKQIKKETPFLGVTTLKGCLEFLEECGWIKYEVNTRPQWTYGDNQEITGKVMVIGEL